MNMDSILITGVTGKVGSRLTQDFLKDGYQVIGTFRREEQIQAFQSSLEYNRDNFVPLQIDLESAGAPSGIKRFLKEKGLRVQHIINNARSVEYLRPDEFGNVNPEQWRGEFYLDVIFPYNLIMEISLAELGLKSSVLVSSIYGVVAAHPQIYKNPLTDSPIHYSVCKAAQIHLARELAVRLAPQNIRVNCVSFGGIQGRASENFVKLYAEQSPQKRMLSELELFAPIRFLLSEGASSVTGHNMIVDGGWTIW